MSHPNLLARGGSLEGIPGAAGSPCPSCSVRRTGAHSCLWFRSLSVRYLLLRGGLPPVSWQCSAGRQPSAGARGTRLAAVGPCPPPPESRHEPEHKPCLAGRRPPRISRCRSVRTGRPRWLRQRRSDRARPRSHTSADGSGDAAGEGPASVGCRPATPGPVPESSPAKKTASTGAGRT